VGKGARGRLGNRGARPSWNGIREESMQGPISLQSVTSRTRRGIKGLGHIMKDPILNGFAKKLRAEWARCGSQEPGHGHSCQRSEKGNCLWTGQAERRRGREVPVRNEETSQCGRALNENLGSYPVWSVFQEQVSL